MRTAPATKYNEVRQQAIDLLDVGGATPLEIMRFRREAQSLRNADPSEGLVIDAIASGLANDIADMQRKFAQAITAGGGVDAVATYAIALEYTNQPLVLRDTVQKYWDDICKSSNYFLAVRDALGRSGYLQTAYRLERDAYKFGIKPRDLGDHDLEEVMGQRRISEDDIRDLVCFVKEELRTRKVRLEHHESAMVHDDDGRMQILYEFVCTLDLENLLDIESEIFAALAEKNYSAETSGAMVVGLARKRSTEEAEKIKEASN